MKLDDILTEWDEDSKIDILSLKEQAASVPKLHAKYSRYLANERMTLKHFNSQMRVLKLKKFEFYWQGPNEETKQWKMPAVGKVMKSDAPVYTDADEDVNKLQLKIDMAEEKVSALESIIRQIHNRHYLITGIMQQIRYEGGA